MTPVDTNEYRERMAEAHKHFTDAVGGLLASFGPTQSVITDPLRDIDHLVSLIPSGSTLEATVSSSGGNLLLLMISATLNVTAAYVIVRVVSKM